MRRFLVQVIFYSFAVFITLTILSIITVPTADHPEGVPLLRIPEPNETNVELDVTIGPVRLNLVVGFVFLVGGAVLPVILAAVFGRWYLRAPGAAFLIVSAVVFWLVSLVCSLLGFTFEVPDPALLWLFVDSVVFGLVFLALDSVFGLRRPHLSDGGQHRPMWSLLDRLPVSRRNQFIENIRMYEVYTVITGYAQEIAVGGTILARFRGLVDRLSGTSSGSLDKLSTAAKVRVDAAAARADVREARPDGGRPPGAPAARVGHGVRQAPEHGPAVLVGRGQRHHHPGARQAARGGLRVDRSRATRGRLAGASPPRHAQGRPNRGRQDQRPGIQAKVRADLGVMQELARLADERIAAARRFGLVSVIEEFADGVLEELDYTTEAYNARRLADVLAPIDGVGVPSVYPELSTKRVLVMDFVNGIKATHADELDPSVEREAVARTLITALIKQLLIDGFFHADPHPGNVVLDPDTGRVTFLDLGLMGELRQEQRLDLIALVWALRMEDPGMLAVIVRRLCTATGPVDDAAFRAAIERMFNRTWVYGTGSFSGVMASLFGILGINVSRCVASSSWRSRPSPRLSSSCPRSSPACRSSRSSWRRGKASSAHSSGRS